MREEGANNDKKREMGKNENVNYIHLESRKVFQNQKESTEMKKNKERHGRRQF